TRLDHKVDPEYRHLAWGLLSCFKGTCFRPQRSFSSGLRNETQTSPSLAHFPRRRFPKRPAVRLRHRRRTPLQGHARGRLVVLSVWGPELQDSYRQVVCRARESFHCAISSLVRSRRPIARGTLHGYTSQNFGGSLELFSFDEAYLKRLREGEAST